MKSSILPFLILYFALYSNAQVGIGTTSIDPSAVLELKSHDKGFLIPRMTTFERNTIPSPTEGLMVYNTDRSAMQVYRENVGTSNTLSGWYDTRCNNDVSTAFSSFPNGITLDFSDLENNGQFFPQTGGGGQAFDASTPTGTGIGSIGPVFTDISDGSAPGFLSYEDKTNEAGNLSANPIFEFVNEEEANPYNASTFAKRIQNRKGQNGDLMTVDLVDYSGDFDLILVAKFNELPSSNNAAFFSTGSSTSGLLIGTGSTTDTICTREYFNMNFANQPFLCGGNTNRVPLDLEFHRFRVKYTDDITGVDAKIEFYIDGQLTEMHQDNNINPSFIDYLDLFNNRNRKSYSHSSIAYLGLYSDFLSDENFEALDKYLACKFESQP